MNYKGLLKDLFVARCYSNQALSATGGLRKAIDAKGVAQTLDAWEYGKQSWRSYLTVLNPSIVPKEGAQSTMME
jgi:hypothetical protein